MAKKTFNRGISSFSSEDIANNFKIIIAPKGDEQHDMIKAIYENDIVFIDGPAGSGKTYMTMFVALQELAKGKYERIMVTRPVVEAAGERLGHLPGDIREKINPYMIPIFETLRQMLPDEFVIKLVSRNGKEAPIMILPLAFMRGCSFRNTFIFCDEAQNTSPEQMRLLLTRIGEGSKIVVCGDMKQSDMTSMRRDHLNGLSHAFEILQGVEGVGFTTLTSTSIVRHPIIARIEERYDGKVQVEIQPITYEDAIAVQPKKHTKKHKE